MGMVGMVAMMGMEWVPNLGTQGLHLLSRQVDACGLILRSIPRVSKSVLWTLEFTDETSKLHTCLLQILDLSTAVLNCR